MFYLGQQTAVITIRAQDKGRVQNRCQHLKSSPKSTTLSKIGSFTHLHLLTWLNGWRSRITVDIIAESILYFLNSAPTLTSSEAGKAWTQYHYFYSLKMSYTTSFCQASLSAFDLSLNKGRQPRTVSSFLSTGAFDPLLVSSILLWTWSNKFTSIEFLRKNSTSMACPACLDLMWAAIPELEASLEVHPTLPLLTSLLQCRHLTSRKSPKSWKIM